MATASSSRRPSAWCNASCARRDLTLEQELRRLDKYDALILDDIGYIQQDRDETEVLFTLLSERYERRSVLISSNLVFSQWDRIFKDPMTTAAAVDRLVHHATILELTGDSYRADSAHKRTRKTAAKGGDNYPATTTEDTPDTKQVGAETTNNDGEK